MKHLDPSRFLSVQGLTPWFSPLSSIQGSLTVSVDCVHHPPPTQLAAHMVGQEQEKLPSCSFISKYKLAWGIGELKLIIRNVSQKIGWKVIKHFVDTAGPGPGLGA